MFSPLEAEGLCAADEFRALMDVFTVWHMGVKKRAAVIMLLWAEYRQPVEKHKWPLLPEVLRVNWRLTASLPGW